MHNCILTATAILLWHYLLKTMLQFLHIAQDVIENSFLAFMLQDSHTESVFFFKLPFICSLSTQFWERWHKRGFIRFIYAKLICQQYVHKVSWKSCCLPSQWHASSKVRNEVSSNCHWMTGFAYRRLCDEQRGVILGCDFEHWHGCVQEAS